MTADALPYNNASGHGTDANGNGSVDYYSLPVAVSCGAVGALMAICCVAPTAVRRGGPAAVLGCGNLLALALHVAAIVCLGLDLIADKDQWVYNPFCGNNQGSRCSTPNYVHISTSVAKYWSDDYYMSWYGDLLYATFSLMIILAFLELLHVLLCLCADEDTGNRYSGARRSYDETSGWGW